MKRPMGRRSMWWMSKAGLTPPANGRTRLLGSALLGAGRITVNGREVERYFAPEVAHADQPAFRCRRSAGQYDVLRTVRAGLGPGRRCATVSPGPDPL